MNPMFEITFPEKLTTGDSLRFSAHEGGKTWPAKISRSLLTVLDTSGRLSLEEIFAANFSRIQKACYDKSRHVEPGQEISITTYDI